MSHIESITFNKFRIFDSEFQMDLKPITFLVGPNSSGKSSILKSFLLLKSNFSSNLQVLDFTGDKHNLATFSNTINKKYKEEDELISFGLKTKLRYQGFFSNTLYKEPITTKRSVFYILREDVDADASTVKLSLFYRKVDRSGKLARMELLLENDDKPFLTLNIANDSSENHSMTLDQNLLKKDKVISKLFLDYATRVGKLKPAKTEKIQKKYTVQSKFTIQEGAKETFYDEPILVFSRLYKLFLDENVAFGKNEIQNLFLKQPIKQILQDFSSILENTEYIEAVRANTKRLYTNDSQGTGFNELILDYNSRDIPEKSIEFINKWLKAFEIADEISWTNVEGVATSIYLKTGDEEIALADLGYGITQFLPILLKVALEQPIIKTAKKDISSQIVKKLILLEEPETNLHPKLQSLLADFIADAIKIFEVRFIIETHSEYIIRRLQILTADNFIKESESVIYYFSSEKEKKSIGEKVTRIDILPNGSLTNDFGEGFFDEATRMKFELLRKKTVK